VLTRAPGQVADETPIDAPLPRPEGFRTTVLFRDAVEHVSNRLERAVR
jgi:NitT/TauT family transport system ATP-binding protein